MSLSPLPRFGQVHKMEAMTATQLNALNAQWAKKGVYAHFVTETVQDPLGKVVALTGRDAEIIDLNLDSVKDFGAQLWAQKNGQRSPQAKGFKNLEYWYAHQLATLTQTYSKKDLILWYVKAPKSQIESLHQHLALWLTRHFSKPAKASVPLVIDPLAQARAEHRLLPESPTLH